MNATAPAKPNAIAAQPLIRLPMWKLSACLLASPKLVVFGAGVAAPLIWTSWKSKVAADFWVAVAVYTGTVAGLAFLWCFGARPVFTWAPLVIGAGVIRMGISLAIAVAIGVALKPDKTFFWSVFLAALLAVLVVETLVIRKAITSALRGPGLSGARDQGTETRAA